MHNHKRLRQQQNKSLEFKGFGILSAIVTGVTKANQS